MTSAANIYPPPGFRFSVSFGKSQSAVDSSFQEVTGSGRELAPQPVPAGGQNRSVPPLPTAATHPKRTLTRGIAALESPLVAWCKSVLEGGLAKTVNPKLLHVFLLDENGQALRAWSFESAYPVHWEVEAFNSTKNEVAVERITLSYAFSTRVV